MQTVICEKGGQGPEGLTRGEGGRAGQGGSLWGVARTRLLIAGEVGKDEDVCCGGRRERERERGGRTGE